MMKTFANKLTRLEEAAFTKWHKDWEAFYTKVGKHLPQKMYDLVKQLDELERQFQDLPEGEQHRINEMQEREAERLISLFGVGDSWLKLREENQEKVLIDFSKPDLTLTPYSIKPAPFDMTPILEVINALEYGIDYLGYTRFHIAWEVAIAKARQDLGEKHGNP
jgi:hypothetical protein